MKDNNKLIAEFMQPSFNGFGTYDFNGCLFNIDELCFENQWNWLMPVVERIQNILDCEYCVTIDQNNCKIWHETDSSFLIESVGYSTIEAVYKSIVEFIINKQQ